MPMTMIGVGRPRTTSSWCGSGRCLRISFVGGCDDQCTTLSRSSMGIPAQVSTFRVYVGTCHHHQTRRRTSRVEPGNGNPGGKFRLCVAGSGTYSAQQGLACALCGIRDRPTTRSEEHTSELQSRFDLVCRLLL